MKWCWLLCSSLLLIPLEIVAQKRVFLKPEEPGEVRALRWKKLQNSLKLVASLHHTSRDSVKNMISYFGFCSQRLILVTQVQGGLVCTSLPGLEPGLSENLYFACTCGVQGTKATFSLARWLHKESWLLYNIWFLGLRTGLIHQSSHDDWSENNFSLLMFFSNNYGFVVMWMLSIFIQCDWSWSF